MSKRTNKRTKAALKERRADFDRIPAEVRQSMTRPGSLNPKKTHGARMGRRKG